MGGVIHFDFEHLHNVGTNFLQNLWVPSDKWKRNEKSGPLMKERRKERGPMKWTAFALRWLSGILLIEYKKFYTKRGRGVRLPDWWWLRKLVARSAMGCVKRGIPETGFVGEEKSALYLAGGGRASVYLPRVFSLYAPGAGMTENWRNKGQIPWIKSVSFKWWRHDKVKCEGPFFCVMPFSVIKMSPSIGRSSLFWGVVGGVCFLTYSLFLVVVGVAKVFLSCWGRSIAVVAYAYSFCQG